MSDAKICDRCGKAFSPYSEERKFFYTLRKKTVFTRVKHDMMPGRTTFTDTPSKFDLCPECSEEHDEFMKGGKR